MAGPRGDGARGGQVGAQIVQATQTHSVPFATVEQRLQEAGLLSGILGLRPESVAGVTDDSRDVRPGSLFVAVTGSVADGRSYVDQAMQAGACGVVMEAGISVPGAVPTLFVTHARSALLELSSLLAGDPGQSLTLVAVTGTNGKTTTATLLADALNRLGENTGFLGTTGYRFGTHEESATHTTPSAPRLMNLLATMQDQAVTACAMEASSHALDQHRLRPSDVDVAVFTNLTRDHLDYHGSEAAYLAAKKLLFDGLSPDAVAVVNADDPAWSALTADCKAKVICVGQGADADMSWTLHGMTPAGLDIEVDGCRFTSRLSGRFNAVNLAMTFAALSAAGYEATRIRDVLECVQPVRGRFEVLHLPGDRTAIVDYAHTPDALEKVLTAARELVATGSLLWVVFGCGGDRDRGKRPLMGRVAEQGADKVVLTSDNPRSEQPRAILDDIRSGMDRATVALSETDRSVAIGWTLRAAGCGDVVVIAGKGHETYQVIGAETRPFDDRAVVLDSVGA